MGRSPKSSSHQKNKRRRRSSSSSDSDNDRQRYQRRHRDNEKSYSSKTKCYSLRYRFSLFLDTRVKQEPVTDDDSRRSRPNKSFESRRNPREKDNQSSHQWGKAEEKQKSNEEPVEKEQPNFGLSGALLKDTNTYKGVVIKYSEPLEARKPRRRWRLYVFKGEQVNSFY